MITFCCAILLLIGGYFLYGKLTEKVFRPDDRPTPAIDHPDGVVVCPVSSGDTAFRSARLTIAIISARVMV